MTMGNRPCGRNAIFKCVAIIATVVTTFSCVACGNAADSGSTADKSAAQSQGKHEKVKKSATQGLTARICVTTTRCTRCMTTAVWKPCI